MRGFHAILVSIRTGRSGLFSGADTDLQVLWAADVDNAFPATHRKAKLPFPSVRRGMLGITAVRDACVALHRPSDSLGDFLGADYARFLPPFSGYVKKEGPRQSGFHASGRHDHRAPRRITHLYAAYVKNQKGRGSHLVGMNRLACASCASCKLALHPWTGAGPGKPAPSSISLTEVANRSRALVM
jgi:hypothetical protein